MDWKRVKSCVGEYALRLLPKKGIVGLGSGTTSEAFILHFAEYVTSHRLDLRCVASSIAIEQLATQLRLPLLTADKWQGMIDVTFDGADAIDSEGTAIKGGGGALLREKIVAGASKRVVYMVDERKWMKPWDSTPLPICIIPFGASATLNHLDRGGFLGRIRMDGELPFTTDDGLWIVDLDLKPPLPSLSQLDATLKSIPGVAETGIFFKYASDIIVGDISGTVTHHKVT